MLFLNNNQQLLIAFIDNILFWISKLLVHNKLMKKNMM